MSLKVPRGMIVVTSLTVFTRADYKSKDWAKTRQLLADNARDAILVEIDEKIRLKRWARR